MKPHESPRINKKSNPGDSWPVWNRGIRWVLLYFINRYMAQIDNFIIEEKVISKVQFYLYIDHPMVFWY